jgi:uncharacterized membrane protein YhaH (DUF805 family)
MITYQWSCVVEFGRLFFSFHGRVGRMVFLGGVAANLLALLTLFLVADSGKMLVGTSSAEVAARIALFIGLLAACGSIASLFVRRAHDWNSSTAWGWLGFVITALISAALVYAAMTEMLSLYLILGAAFILLLTFLPFGSFKGSHEANRFGPKPQEDDNLVSG